MDLMRTNKPSFNRRALATQAMQAAIATRAKAKLDQHGPICIYGLSETLGVTVRFNNINMEGMYQRASPPRIPPATRASAYRARSAISGTSGAARTFGASRAPTAAPARAAASSPGRSLPASARPARC